jgi:hypothetical protein
MGPPINKASFRFTGEETRRPTSYRSLLKITKHLPRCLPQKFGVDALTPRRRPASRPHPLGLSLLRQAMYDIFPQG